MNLTLALPILLIPFLGTVLGAGFVLFLRESPSETSTKALLGFASGVMVAAAVWSLLIPAIGMNESAGKIAAVPVAAGFLLGIGFLLLMGTDSPEGPRSRLSRTAMLALAVTLHNIPEGMAVGVVIAGAIEGAADISMAGAVALAAGIALQNVPEGAIISMPLRNEGNSRLRSFGIGAASGIVEPAGAILTILLATHIEPVLPVLLAFAAGAMIYVVVEELIPEASEGSHSNIGTIGFAAGFALMMVLDTVSG